MSRAGGVLDDFRADCVALGRAVNRYRWLSAAVALFAVMEASAAWQHSIGGMVASPLVFGVVAMWRLDAERVRHRLARRRPPTGVG